MPASKPNAKRILVVDDHPIVSQGYYYLVNNQPDLEVCGFAFTVQEALTQIEATRPHLAIVDLSLKEGHGLDLIRQARARHEHLKMLVVSAHDEHLFGERALEAGAQGYINKQEATHKLIDGIRAVLRDEVYVSEQLLQKVLKSRVAPGKTAPEASSVKLLTNRELEVFDLIGQGLATRQIAEKMHLSAKTIERYKENIKNKLRLHNATELVQRATQWRMENL